MLPFLALALGLLPPLLEVRGLSNDVPGAVNGAVLGGADGQALSDAVTMRDDGGCHIGAHPLRGLAWAFLAGLNAPVLVGE